MDEAQVKHLAVVLCNMTDTTIDWAKVAEIRGIARKDNAVAPFKNLMKKIGVDYSNNKFSLIDPAAMLSADPKPPKTPKTPKTSSPRKRKAKATQDNGDEDKDESASPKKKSRARKAVEKEEVTEDSDVEVKEATDEDDAA